MKKMWILPALVLCVASLGAAPAQKAPPPVDREALAKKLVHQCAGIRENELVVISGGSRETELLENIAVHVRMLGAHPLLAFGSDRMNRRMFDDVPSTYDSQTPLWDQKLAEAATAWISVDLGAEPGMLAHVPPERFAARGKAFQSITEMIYKRNARQLNLGNGLYPSAGLAKQFGITKEQLSKIFWDGVSVDYAKLQQSGDAVRAALAGGKELHITNPNGTDLKVRVEGRPVFVSDGVISDEDAQKGGAACQVWLPAGEVFLAPVAGTAEGRVVVDHQFYQGKDIEGLTLTYAAGKLVSMTARSGLEPLKMLYDASGEGKDAFGVIDLGINEGVRIPAGSRMQAWMPAGMVTVGVGNDMWAGGTNNSTFGLNSFLPGSTVKVDGREIVAGGRLDSALLSTR